MQDQDEFITRDTNFEGVAVVANDKVNLEDVGCNADLYIANQEDFTQGAILQPQAHMRRRVIMNALNVFDRS